MMPFDELVKNINVLLADDDDDYVLMTENFLKSIGYSVDVASDGEETLEMLRKKDYQILLLDYFMPILNGEEVVKEVRKTNKELVIILQTGFSGQKPPLEMMRKLNIQSYYDKTEGISKLNYELATAVRIFEQQNQIEMSKYRTNAIGNLVSGVAQEIKSNLLSVGAGLEYTNMLLNDNTVVNKESIEKINKFYNANKFSLQKVDKVLTSIIGQTSENTNYIMSDSDIIEIMTQILSSFAQEKNIELTIKKALKSNSYIDGCVNDTIFISCEVIKQLINVQEENTKIDFVLTEDAQNWFFSITSDSINKLSLNKLLLLKKLVVSMKGLALEINNSKIVFKIAKVD
ncbi:MAG: response regulator [Clostridia bacterium]